MKFYKSLRNDPGKFVFDFDENWIGDDVIVTSFHAWYQYKSKTT